MPRDKGTEPTAIDTEDARATALRVAMDMAGEGAVAPGFTRQKRRKFIELLANGLNITEASAKVGISRVHVHHLRRSDPAFGAAVTAVLEFGSDEVTARLRNIALYGDPGNTATVRAGEIYLKSVHSAYQAPSRVTLSRRLTDGTIETIKRVGTSGLIPD